MPPRSRNKSQTEPDTTPETVEPSHDETVTETTAESVESHHDETDVTSALKRDTQDGKGEGEVPPSDFDSFATEGVQSEDKDLGDLVSEILRGDWGDYGTLRDRLREAGYDDSEAITAVNLRLTRGAPAAYRASKEEIINQIERGEWGDTNKALESRLLGAGYRASEVAEILQSVKKL